MRCPSSLTALLTVAALQGCAQALVATDTVIHTDTAQGIPSGTPLCQVNANNVGNCVIELTVSDIVFEPKSCTVQLRSADNDLLTLKAAQPTKQDVFIYWRIVDSEDYIFTKDGVAFVDNFRPRMFSDGERLEPKNEFQWQLVGEQRRINGYIVNVRKGNRKCSLDPWIRNRS